MCYGRLVRKAELSVLGNVQPAMQSTQHIAPSILASLRNWMSKAAFTT